MAKQERCPLADCKQPVERAEQDDSYFIQCPRCGKFVISQTFGVSVHREFLDDMDLRSGLREFIRAENEQGNSPLLITQRWQIDAEKYKPSVWGQKQAAPKGE